METIGLIISCILSLALITYLGLQKKKNQLQNMFIIDSGLTFLWSALLIAQKYFCTYHNVDPIIFEWFVYICAAFMPVAILFTSLVFANTKLTFKKKYIIFFIIPILDLIMLWTNDLHHLFYEVYTTSLGDVVYGKYINIYVGYNYILYAISAVYLLKYSIKNSGIFSKQAILFTIALLIPTIVNLLGFLKIVYISIYVTPICFTITILLCALAVFKFDFLRATPIALQKIVDRISDGYLILDENNVIIDFNKTFLDTFHLDGSNLRNIEIFDFLSTQKRNLVDEKVLKDALERVKISPKTISFDKEFKPIKKYFHIEINTIISKDNLLGTLILFKDTTQHIRDMKTIQDNQDMLVERERFASLRTNDWWYCSQLKNTYNVYCRSS